MIRFVNRMPFGGVTVKDVDAHDFVKAFIAHLKKYVYFVFKVFWYAHLNICKHLVGIN